MPRKLHHVAYRCRDARETVDFYTRVVGMPFVHAIINERVPSLQDPCPHIHIFFGMDDGSCLAFFELAEAQPAQKDPNTPDWVQHLALEVADVPTLLASKRRLEEAGVEVVGPTNHGFCQSIYFIDPSGHRMELTAPTETEEQRERYRAQAPQLLEAWAARRAVASK
jgi:catechol 2,3-dioxygenase-like lactoylglutathione lyase family enzyme